MVLGFFFQSVDFESHVYVPVFEMVGLSYILYRPDVFPHPVIQQSGLPIKLLVPRARAMISALLEVTSPDSSSRAMSLGNPAPLPL